MLTPRHRFRREEAMAKSHQRGTVRLEHHSWVGYMNVKVLDPSTGESKWKKQRVGVLGPKSKMTKHQAQDSLDVTIAQRPGVQLSRGRTSASPLSAGSPATATSRCARAAPGRRNSPHSQVGHRDNRVIRSRAAPPGEVRRRSYGAYRQVHVPDAPQRPCPHAFRRPWMRSTAS